MSYNHTRLTRDSAVLLLIDYQIGPLWELDASQLRRDVVHLATTASRLGVPTVLTAMACDDWGPIIPELTQALPDAPVIERSVVEPWDAARIRQAISVTGRQHLIVAGLPTEVSVVSVALAATGAGYTVHAVIDASGHFDRRAATTALVRILKAGARVTDSATALFDLARDGPDAQASEVLSIALCHLLTPPPGPRQQSRASGARRTAKNA